MPETQSHRLDPYHANNYELHYNDGGHGGPYLTYVDAVESAKRLIRGRPLTQSIEIRIGVGGPLVERITREQVDGQDQNATPALDYGAWRTANAGRLQVVAAYGDWHPLVPSGWVGVDAIVGGIPAGRYDCREHEHRYFIVPATEYRNRWFGFVVDPARHIEVKTDFGESE